MVRDCCSVLLDGGGESWVTGFTVYWLLRQWSPVPPWPCGHAPLETGREAGTSAQWGDTQAFPAFAFQFTESRALGGFWFGSRGLHVESGCSLQAAGELEEATRGVFTASGHL